MLGDGRAVAMDSSCSVLLYVSRGHAVAVFASCCMCPCVMLFVAWCHAVYVLMLCCMRPCVRVMIYVSIQLLVPV